MENPSVGQFHPAAAVLCYLIWQRVATVRAAAVGRLTPRPGGGAPREADALRPCLIEHARGTSESGGSAEPRGARLARDLGPARVHALGRVVPLHPLTPARASLPHTGARCGAYPWD